MTPEGTPRPRKLPPVIPITALILLAALLRVWRLGHWGLEGDEVFTFQDSVRLQLNNPRPLLYLLNHFLVRPLMPLDELGLRLLPALFGVLAVPALFFVSRQLVGSRAALLGSLLLVFNPFHVYQSQYARYWSLVFLLSAVYPFAIYLSLRERNPRLMVLGIVTGLLAVLAHPVTLLLAGGLSVWLLTQLRREHLSRLWDQAAARWTVGVIALLIGASAVRYIPMLLDWVSMHDRGARLQDHLLTLPTGMGVKQAGILLTYVDGLTLPLALIGAMGIYLLWLRGERSLAVLLTCLFIVPVGVMLLLSFRTAVSVTYMFSTTPIFFIGAGVFLDRLAALDWQLRPSWLLPAAVAVIVITAGAPTLISQYRDGRRQDFRGAAAWLRDHLRPGDLVYSDQFRTISLYLPGIQVQHLSADPGSLGRTLDQLHESRPAGTLWLVVPYSARGGHRTTPKLNSFKEWLYNHCQLREAIGVARLDFRHNELQIYRCPPAPPEGVTARKEAP